MNKYIGLAGLAIAATLGLAASAQADTLTFDGNICIGGRSCFNGSLIDQSYGDIAGQLDVQWDYDISSNLSNFGPQNFHFWRNGYSTLTNVAWANFNATGEIFLKPLAGYQIALNGWALGAYPNVDRTTQVTLLGGDGSFLGMNPADLISGVTGVSYITSHYSPRSDGFRIQYGPDAYNVGIDNISFDVTRIRGGAVPEPGTWAMMIIGFGAAGSMIRRRRGASATA